MYAVEAVATSSIKARKLGSAATWSRYCRAASTGVQRNVGCVWIVVPSTGPRRWGGVERSWNDRGAFSQ